MKTDLFVSPRQNSRGRLLRWAAWLCFANTFLMMMVGWRYVTVMGFPDEPLARLFLFLASLGHFSMVAMIPFLMLSLLVLLFPNRTTLFIVGVLLTGLLLVILVSDSLVFALYRFHFNGMVWSLIRNGNLGEILPLSTNTFIIAGAIVVGAMLLESGLAWVIWKWTKAITRRGSIVAIAIVTVVVAFQLMYIWADAVHYVPITKIAGLFPGCRPLTARKFLLRHGWIQEVNYSSLKFKPSKTALKYPLVPVVCQPPARPLNVMVIVIDCWRFDMLNGKVTPNLWEFSQHNLRFDHHSAAANTTRFGIFSLFYGLYGTYWHAMLGERRGPVLIHEFDAAHYQFGIFASAALTSPEFDRTVFSEIKDRVALKTPGDNAPQRDQIITREMVNFLDKRQRDQPFFAFVFYDSPHAFAYPKEAPAPFQPAAARVDHLKLNKHHDPVLIRNRFLNAVHYTDSLVVDILKRLEQESLLENTVVMITGDHGEEFNESGQNYWGHNNNFSRYQTRVPLIVHWPGKEPATISHATSHLDVAPALLSLVLNCATDTTNYSLGYSLFDPQPRIPLVAATWDRFAICSPGRIDVMYDVGYTESFDEEYRPISTPIPPRYISIAMEGISRFHARRTSARSSASR